MKSSFTRSARLGALGVASALALGGVVVASASAEEGAVAPTEGAAFDALAAEFFQDPTVSGVIYDAAGNVTVQQIVGDEAPSAVTGTIDATAVPGVVQSAAAEVASKYSNVTIVPVAEEDAPQTVASTDVVGGAGIALGADGQPSGLCSVGFAAWTPEGEDAVITAGHCTGDGSFTETWLTVPSGDQAGGGAEDNSDLALLDTLGATGFNQFGGSGNSAGETVPGQSLDVGVIDVTNENLSILPEMTNWENTDDLSQSIASNITAVGAVDLNGGPVQRSGRTTGYSSGPTDAELTGAGYLRVGGADGVARVVKGFASQQQVIPGDSGGTVLQGSTAVGIASATFAVDGLEYMWAADLVENLEATGGYTVKFDIAEPVFTSPETDSTVAPSSAINGTAAAGNTLKYAFLPAGADDSDYDWSQAAETSVDGNGNFSFGAPTDEGSYKIIARATDGSYNVSGTSYLDLVVENAPTPAPEAPAITNPENGAVLNSLDQITGTAEANATITFASDFANGETVSDDAGHWSVPTNEDGADIAYGEHTFTVSQTVDGQTSPNATVTFTLEEKQAPAAPEWLNPVDGAEVAAGAGTFTGAGVDGAEVSVYVDDVEIGKATVSAGVWELKHDGLAAGARQLSAVQWVDGVSSEAAIINVTVAEGDDQSPPPSEHPNEHKDDQNNDDDRLHPTGAEFDAAGPIFLGLGMVLVAGAALTVARVRSSKANR